MRRDTDGLGGFSRTRTRERSNERGETSFDGMNVDRLDFGLECHQVDV